MTANCCPRGSNHRASLEGQIGREEGLPRVFVCIFSSFQIFPSSFGFFFSFFFVLVGAPCELKCLGATHYQAPALGVIGKVHFSDLSLTYSLSLLDGHFCLILDGPSRDRRGDLFCVRRFRSQPRTLQVKGEGQVTRLDQGRHPSWEILF